jgi:hypothetical protein
MTIKRDIGRLLKLVLALVSISGTVVVIAQTDVPARDDLVMLKSALQDAGAASLTSAREANINTLMREFRSVHQPSPNEAIQSARSAYENAILSGDSATASAQAQFIGNAQAEDMVKRESDAAVLTINVVNILKTQCGQLEALTAKLGTGGTARLLLNLAGGLGGGPGRGPGRGGFGPGGPGPQGMRSGPPPTF